MAPWSRYCQQPVCLLCRRVLPSEYSVLLGALSLGVTSPHELLVPVLRVLLPPDYSEDEARGDLALLQLRHPVSLSARIQPVCLPAPGSHPSPGSPCWVTGWGSLRPGGKTCSQTVGTSGHPFLLHLTMSPGLLQSQCGTQHHGSPNLPSTQTQGVLGYKSDPPTHLFPLSPTSNCLLS